MMGITFKQLWTLDQLVNITKVHLPDGGRTLEITCGRCGISFKETDDIQVAIDHKAKLPKCHMPKNVTENFKATSGYVSQVGGIDDPAKS